MNFRLINHKTKRLSAIYLTDVYDLSNGNKEFIYCCVPNGELGITVILEGDCHIKTGDGWQKQSKVHLYGLIDKVQLLKMSPNYREISMGFYPHYLQLFLKDSLYSTNKSNGTDLFDLFKKEEVNKLYENLSQCKNDEALMDKIEGFLKANILTDELDKRVSAAHYLISKEHVYKVDDLSSMLNVTSTTLRTLFNQHVGISPKDLIKIHRIKEALDCQLTCEESLTQMAYQLKYFDQAHFSKDFKNSIGISPKQYFLDSKLSSDFSDFQHWRYDSFENITK
jgi:AraC-like DNA-binding protein